MFSRYLFRSVLNTAGVAGFAAVTAIVGGAQVAHAQNGGNGTFLSTYKGPTASDLLVNATNVIYNGTSFLFTATLAAPVETTAGAYYVWGVNRGGGTAGFATLGATTDESKVLFDSVVIARLPTDPINTASVANGNALSPSALTFSGNTLSLVVPVADLLSNGFAPSAFTANLWPRFEGSFGGSSVTGNAQISQFAPNNANFAITSTAAAPEPGALAMLSTAFALGAPIGVVIRRRASRKA